jgi:hypothetical protein
MHWNPNPEEVGGISKAPLPAPSPTMSLPSDNTQEGLIAAGTNQKPVSTLKQEDWGVHSGDGCDMINLPSHPSVDAA